MTTISFVVASVAVTSVASLPMTRLSPGLAKETAVPLIRPIFEVLAPVCVALPAAAMMPAVGVVTVVVVNAPALTLYCTLKSVP